MIEVPAELISDSAEDLVANLVVTTAPWNSGDNKVIPVQIRDDDDS